VQNTWFEGNFINILYFKRRPFYCLLKHSGAWKGLLNLTFIVVNCEWAEWGLWADCQVTCGHGKMRRTRDIAVKLRNGGKECTGSEFEEQHCFTNHCPGKNALLNSTLKTNVIFQLLFKLSFLKILGLLNICWG
jgi:hypothetical protein